tara:strand:- start:2551 stop:3000 length:450 start_codon:yes stop_codon:yes gene_type:complete
MTLKVYKVRKNAKIPERAHPTDAGMDFFFCPDEEVAITIPPGSSTLLMTGVKVEVPESCMLQIMNKSGIASKRSLVTGACVVDSGYDGEIFVNIHNIGKTPQTILPGHKIAQGVFVEIRRPMLVETTSSSVYGSETSRGHGALGSTGDK